VGREGYLFCEGDRDAALRLHQESLGAKVDAILRDQFMNERSEEVVDHIVSVMAVGPLALHEDRAEVEQREP
jgi:uncharacterized glyoxalase superfamily protein PhnB